MMINLSYTRFHLQRHRLDERARLDRSSVKIFVSYVSGMTPALFPWLERRLCNSSVLYETRPNPTTPRPSSWGHPGRSHSSGEARMFSWQ